MPIPTQPRGPSTPRIVAATTAPTVVETARVRLGQLGEPLDVGMGRHVARARRAFDFACVVPGPGGVAAGERAIQGELN